MFTKLENSSKVPFQDGFADFFFFSLYYFKVKEVEVILIIRNLGLGW